MILSKISRIFNKQKDKKETVPYKLAEQIIRTAMKGGTRSVNIKCWPKEIFFGDKNELSDLLEEEPDSPIQIRPRNYVLGISLRGNGKEQPYMSLPVSLFLPLLNILSSEKTEYKGKKCFPLFKETSSEKTIDKYLDLTLYWESDSSLSIDFEEIQ